MRIIFGIQPGFNSTIDFKEELERYLFQKGVIENKTIVLLIDEGQKLSSENLEVLRTLLNYETNEFKLLQLVIMSQMELLPRIKRINNFIDRIALKYTINPLDEEETKEMIRFRLLQAGYARHESLFTDGAIKKIYRDTQGYPRKIAMLCHDALETIIMHEKFFVDEELVSQITAAR
jgi:general secretion pathway protein A